MSFWFKVGDKIKRKQQNSNACWKSDMIYTVKSMHYDKDGDVYISVYENDMSGYQNFFEPCEECNPTNSTCYVCGGIVKDTKTDLGYKIHSIIETPYGYKDKICAECLLSILS